MQTSRRPWTKAISGVWRISNQYYCHCQRKHSREYLKGGVDASKSQWEQRECPHGGDRSL
jgi:hypothetical protein